MLTDGGASVMEIVAREKVGLDAAAASSTPGLVTASLQTLPPSWRPGLFEAVVGGRVSDVLGLADVVFPSMLSGWAARFDRLSNTSLLSYTLFGYGTGEIVLELLQTGRGQPALLYLVPWMFASFLFGVFREKVPISRLLGNEELP